MIDLIYLSTEWLSALLSAPHGIDRHNKAISRTLHPLVSPYRSLLKGGLSFIWLPLSRERIINKRINAYETFIKGSKSSGIALVTQNQLDLLNCPSAACLWVRPQ